MLRVKNMHSSDPLGPWDKAKTRMLYINTHIRISTEYYFFFRISSPPQSRFKAVGALVHKDVPAQLVLPGSILTFNHSQRNEFTKIVQDFWGLS